MIKQLQKRVKNLDLWDIGLTKWSVVFFMMFVFAVWPAFRDFVMTANPLVLFLIFATLAVRPIMRFFSK